MVRLFEQAATERRRLSFLYKGRRREACPHVVGWTEGRARALVFQYAGESSRGLSPGGDWRCINLDEVSDATLAKGPWMTVAYRERQSCVVDIAVEVAGPGA